jgi:hypothetical protein
MMSLWDALRMNMMISYQELVRTFLSGKANQGYLAHFEKTSFVIFVTAKASTAPSNPKEL